MGEGGHTYVSISAHIPYVQDSHGPWIVTHSNDVCLVIIGPITVCVYVSFASCTYASASSKSPVRSIPCSDVTCKKSGTYINPSDHSRWVPRRGLSQGRGRGETQYGCRFHNRFLWAPNATGNAYAIVWTGRDLVFRAGDIRIPSIERI